MTFRRFGGITFSSTNNYVHSEYTNNSNLNITTRTGQPNSKELFRSHIDLSGNSILNVGCIYFEDGTVLCTAPTTSANANTNVNTNTNTNPNTNTYETKSNNYKLEIETSLLIDHYNEVIASAIPQMINDKLKTNVANTKQLQEDLSKQLQAIVTSAIPQLVADQFQEYTKKYLKPLQQDINNNNNNDVCYRGEGYIVDNKSTYIYIPFSQEFNADDFHLQVTPIYNPELGKMVVCNVLKISSNLFEVFGENCSFYWHATGTKI